MCIRDSSYEYTNESVKTKNDFNSLAIKSFYSQVLDLAKESAYKDDVSIREFQFGCFSFHKKDLPQAKQMIREFVENFAHLNGKDKGDDVYQFAIQLFPLTQDLNKKDMR